MFIISEWAIYLAKIHHLSSCNLPVCILKTVCQEIPLQHIIFISGSIKPPQGVENMHTSCVGNF